MPVQETRTPKPNPVKRAIQWVFERRLAKLEVGVAAQECADRYLCEDWEGAGDAEPVSVEHGVLSNLRTVVTASYKGRNHKIRRRAERRFTARVVDLRFLVEELKANINGLTESATDMAFLRYKARQLIDNKIAAKEKDRQARKKAEADKAKLSEERRALRHENGEKSMSDDIASMQLKAILGITLSRWDKDTQRMVDAISADETSGMSDKWLSDVRRAKNFHINALVALYHVKTEDEVLMDKILENALSAVPAARR
jgi:hypothetical protein